jgi:hypothetical protein
MAGSSFPYAAANTYRFGFFMVEEKHLRPDGVILGPAGETSPGQPLSTQLQRPLTRDLPAGTDAVCSCTNP